MPSFSTKGVRWIITFLAFILVISAYPYVFDRFFPLPSMQFVSIVMAIIFVFFLIVTNKTHSVPIVFTVCFFIQVLTWFFYYFIHDDASYFTRIFFLLLAYVTCLVLQNYGGLLRFMRINTTWIAIQAVLGFVALILVIAGVLSPLLTSENLDGRPVYFFGITCTNAYYGSLMRPAGFFDEPGALAFWGIYALIFNKLFINNRKIEYALVIGLLSTLSLAYFIQITLYFVLFSLKRLRSSIILLGLVGVLVYVIYSQGDNSGIYELTFQRVENNMINGTNRDQMLEDAKDVYSKHPVFGVGGKNMEKYGYLGDNPYEILAKDGVVGMIITYLPFILMLFLCKNRNIYFAMLILSVGYMQRPLHIAFLHYFILYSFFLLCLYAIRNKDAEKQNRLSTIGNGCYSGV